MQLFLMNTIGMISSDVNVKETHRKGRHILLSDLYTVN